MNRQKLSINDQIAHMKDNGIMFNIVSEDSAKDYLEKNNYYFRLKAYAKNYEKYNSGPNKGKYYMLEFAYLIELAKIDMRLRSIIFSLTLDIEHYIKKQLINDIIKEDSEDGYSIVKEVFYIDELKDIEDSKKGKSVCSDLVCKYQNDWPVWALVEVLSFSQTVRLYHRFYDKYDYKNYPNIDSLLYSVRLMRNATAHNNCLLNTIKKSYYFEKFRFNQTIFDELCKTTLISHKSEVEPEAIKGNYCITSKRLKKKMENPIINDFIVMLVAYKRIVSSNSLKKHRLKSLVEFFDTRVIQDKTYFEKNEPIKTTYKFTKKVLTFLLSDI